MIFLTNACSYTKYVPDGQLLLMNNHIKVNQTEDAPGEAEDILKQKPNVGFWLVSPHAGFYISPSLGIYNWGDNSDSSFFSRVGNAPVILDTAKVSRGAAQLQNWYFNKGYFNATSSYKIDSLRKNSKKAEVTYRVTTGRRYFISRYTKEVESKNLEGLINYFSKKDDSLVKAGDPYDAELLQDERSRLAQIFRNQGYYNFSKNFISFEADTLMPGDSVSIKMIVAQRPVEVGDSTYLTDHEVYRINEVYIRPDLDLRRPDKPNDTLVYNTYQFLYDTLKYKPRYLTDAIHFKESDKYDERDVKDTYNHLVGYKAFQLTQINFVPAQRDSSGPTLDAYVNLTPLEKWTFTVEPEVTFTNTNPGINGSVALINRNFLGGGEAFEIRINSGIEQQPTTGNTTQTTREIGGEVSIQFPRFLLPFDTEGLLPKRMQPSSRVGLYYNYLQRIEFYRQTFGGRLSYNWRESRRKAHTIDLLDLSYSRVFQVSPVFLNSLTDIQRRAFTSEFISAIRYTYILDEQLENERDNPRYFKGSLELAGNGLSVIDSWTTLGTDLSNGARGIFDVQYYQYLKLEVDGRYFWNLRNDMAWVNRVYSGYILPYGNSNIQTDTGIARIPPFSKYFFMGGSNDLRAWTAYRLGAGVQPNTNYSSGNPTSFATGTFKILVNSEYRFPILSLLKGAVFVDAGNIWYSGGLENTQTDIVLKDLINEFAVGTGFGLRLDFDFFVIRFDLGIKVRDPALISKGDEWVIFTRNVPKNFTYNIALGYPF